MMQVPPLLKKFKGEYRNYRSRKRLRKKLKKKQLVKLRTIKIETRTGMNSLST